MPTKKHKTYYCVLYIQLEPGDEGYEDGYRFMAEQVDKDRHFFRTRAGQHGSDQFMQIHGMKAITQAQMDAGRRELGIE